jgi:hypothetical protein
VTEQFVPGLKTVLFYRYAICSIIKKEFMREKGSSKKERGGDTQRTSSQGQKISSGGKVEDKKRGNPEEDDRAHSRITEMKPPRQRRS